MRVTAADDASLDDLLQQLTTSAAIRSRERDALLKPAEKDRCVPDDFYSTTNHRTHVRLGGQLGRGRAAAHGRRDRRRRRAAACRKLRDVQAGEPVVCGHDGIRVTPEFRERDRLGFAFMSNDVSSERRVEGSVARIADDDARRRSSRAAASPSSPGRSWSTPAASSTSPSSSAAATSTCVLAGNALAVHDIEFALSGTSLGIDLVAGAPGRAGPSQSHGAPSTRSTAPAASATAVETGRADVAA